MNLIKKVNIKYVIFIVCAVHLNEVRENKSRRLRWTVYVARMKEASVIKILTGKPIEKRLLERTREVNIIILRNWCHQYEKSD
jgi:hypothetical protein